MATLDPTTPEARAKREADRARTLAICEALGLDPEATTSLSLEFAPGGAMSARWSGFTVLGDVQRARVAEIIGGE